MAEDAPDPMVSLLREENIPALEQALASGWDIDRFLRLSQYSWMSPLNLALSEGRDKLLDFLIERKADLNPKQDPPLIWAIGNGCPMSTIEKLIARGARLDGINQVGTNAYLAALYANRFELLSEFFRLGLPIDADGGQAMRSAVFNRKLDAVKFFIEHGHDPNARTADMVHPDNPTAVAVAARNGDFEIVKYLVEQGADITLTNEYGDRPYTNALKAKHVELQEYLKAREPSEWHTEESHLRRMATYQVPPDLIQFLKSADRRIELEDCWPKYIEFHPLEHVKELTRKRSKVLDLLAEVDNYDETGYLVWSPRHGKVAHADIEHDQFTVLCTWKSFIAKPSKWIGRLCT
jgi:uncharacterized protein